MYGSYLPSIKLFTRSYAVIKFTWWHFWQFFLAKVLIYVAYYKMVAEGVMFSLTRCHMNWTDKILALSYTLPRSRFQTEISMITSWKMCDMPVCYNKKTTEKSYFFFVCAQLLLHHIETGSIQTFGFITLSWQPGIGDMERMILIRGLHYIHYITVLLI